ncbi:cation:proton antiporter domain-containing protein [Bariatricus sp. HCP28S3_E2]|uniref:cation:proton antiporter domain-containing protein n=1 Tax=Bariatricus sp. HCP28S3_E2 TaxID=3438902 RepID=UPI003F898600
MTEGGLNTMLGFLPKVVILLLLIVLLGFFNEKITKFPYEISLMLFSIVISMIMLIFDSALRSTSISELLSNLQVFNLEALLMEGVLCFMLFAGSCHMRLLDFKKHARPITMLSVVATLLGAIFYGSLFYAGASLLGLPFSFPVCLMFGSITAPTDPIAATSILKKFNLPKDISFIMEGESLFNDGVGVALFVCFSGMVTMQENGSFLAVMGKELFGAVLVGILATAICFPIFALTKDGNRRIFVSLLAVSMAYVLCEHFGFSGAIASLVLIASAILSPPRRPPYVSSFTKLSLSYPLGSFPAKNAARPTLEKRPIRLNIIARQDNKST